MRRERQVIYAAAVAVLGAAGYYYRHAVARLLNLTPPTAPKPLPKPAPRPRPAVFQASPQQLASAVGHAAWRRITLPSGASVEVMTEPAREGSLYLPATYETADKVARQLGASLLTPVVSDAIYTQADSQLVPCTLPASDAMASLDYVKRHSECVLAQDPRGLVGNAGKNWVRGLKLGKNQAANHGWYDKGAPNGYMWQDKGRRHNRQHVDYSQTVTLMRNLRDAQDNPRSFDEVLRGPDWKMLGTEQESQPSA